ncbi:MAG: GIY-YIG nuclease family protein [Acidobacteria bacterium]|nr:GIY-YIG nuclease family protein [Acidobacteriota bacterium]
MWSFTEFIESWGRIYCRLCNPEAEVHGTNEGDDASPQKAYSVPHGIVYLLKMGLHYKIGKTKDFEKRLDQIRLLLPEPVEVIHKIETDDPDGIEVYWHNRFSGKRKKGEWFSLSDEDVAVFKSRSAM